MAYIPDQGDVVLLSFDPSTGKDIMKRRSAYVISRKIFNEHTGLAIVAPISSTVRGIKLEVVLPDRLKTKGAVLVHQLKALDFNDREVMFIEKVMQKEIEEIKVLAKLLVE
ncbi:MAG: type II toxin-antitoxin system PemK/MazF family toxin [Methylococcales bacterium]|nr:type II toxin-antitoxin system PemK/MazF family toxin [Methylococcales bacterium]